MNTQQDNTKIQKDLLTIYKHLILLPKSSRG